MHFDPDMLLWVTTLAEHEEQHQGYPPMIARAGRSLRRPGKKHDTTRTPEESKARHRSFIDELLDPYDLHHFSRAGSGSLFILRLVAGAVLLFVWAMLSAFKFAPN